MSALPRGDVWLADLDPIRGHEQAGRRPVLVVSDDDFNTGPADLVVVLPMTSTLRSIASRVPVAPPEGGVRQPSMILCEGIRSVSRERLIARWGSVGPVTLAAVEDRLRILLRL